MGKFVNIKAVCLMVSLLSLLLIGGCDSISTAREQQAPTEAKTSYSETYKAEEGKVVAHTIRMKIGEQDFSVRLEDNPTAQVFEAELPLTLTMKELNGNEKYGRLDRRLPSDDENPGQIQAGDLMLYSSDCVVLFYKDFPTSYRYTRLGRMEYPENMENWVGNDDITVVFLP